MNPWDILVLKSSHDFVYLLILNIQVGDILILNENDQIPCDIVLLTSSHDKVRYPVILCSSPALMTRSAFYFFNSFFLLPFKGNSLNSRFRRIKTFEIKNYLLNRKSTFLCVLKKIWTYETNLRGFKNIEVLFTKCCAKI